jgi:hypothetical protein
MEHARHFSIWADYAHLQYTSALCIVFGATTGYVVADVPMEPSWAVITLGTVLFLAGLIADWRLHSMRATVERIELRTRLRARKKKKSRAHGTCSVSPHGRR